jgi:hypothetical protein
VVLEQVSLYKAPVIRNLLHGVALAALAATAVDFGFRSAFIREPIAYALTLYTCALIALLVGRTPVSHWSQLVVARLPIAVAVGAGTLASLRSWALLPIAIGRGTTTGHSPYVVFIVAGLLLCSLNQGLRRLPNNLTSA